jgi:hypothetical protein
LRAGKAYGQTDHVKATLPKDKPLIFAVLPYEVKGLAVELGGGKIADGKLPIKVFVQTEAKAGDLI